LACSALDEMAVSRLRVIKHRDQKPFAVMFRDNDQLEAYVTISPEERDVLNSREAPIVLLANFPHTALAPSVNPKLSRIGAMLPYTPLQVLLMKEPMPPLIMTSANLSDDPLVSEDEMAWEQFGEGVDGVVMSNRPIHNRSDDSVVMIVDGKVHIIRRARGYVPDPVLVRPCVEGVLAVGAELKNTFCLGRDHLAIMGPHIGDLKTPASLAFFEEALGRFRQLFRFDPKWIVHDLHPDYESTRWARTTGIPLVGVQHHHAHIASVMVEHDVNEKIIGIALDGVGYGDDGTLWGGEWLECDLTMYVRKGHLPYLSLLGGDQAVKEPWRLALAVLIEAGFSDDDVKSLLSDIEPSAIEAMFLLMRSTVPAIRSCSAGRWFDAISALIGFCSYQEYEGQAPMIMEQSIKSFYSPLNPYPFGKGKTPDLEPMLRVLVADKQARVPWRIISQRFHDTIVVIIRDWAVLSRDSSGIDRVALSGGVFQNRYLLSRSIECFREEGFEVLCSEQVPCNDGGISLGQVAVASARLNLEDERCA
jgi:hydrogenase maturation protein HypF